MIQAVLYQNEFHPENPSISSISSSLHHQGRSNRTQLNPHRPHQHALALSTRSRRLILPHQNRTRKQLSKPRPRITRAGDKSLETILNRLQGMTPRLRHIYSEDNEC
jgi:hypothetical protein